MAEVAGPAIYSINPASRDFTSSLPLPLHPTLSQPILVHFWAESLATPRVPRARDKTRAVHEMSTPNGAIVRAWIIDNHCNLASGCIHSYLHSRNRVYRAISQDEEIRITNRQDQSLEVPRMLENLGDCPDISGPLRPEGSLPVRSRIVVLRRISYLRLRCMRRELFTMWCCCPITLL